MQALILLAHGSRRAESNREVQAMAEQLAARLPGFRVSAAFLELSAPDIATAIDRAVAQGAGRVLLLPYFLAAGRHVVEDIPAIVEERRTHYAEVEMLLLPYLGAAPGMADFLAALVPTSP
ncbi:sirohydrochlorin chelatase [Alkalilimnicola sp. S0819]|uniref:sirohydrochlorin chelatase n=1 Tax=Alkalilimnicola sp. S0819 TaxID=2613922 RepID=UPI001261A39B|nr:CbiX/SirB N-terminal domain-containing protein [Alkalilimnicola sp. S0819]KAB7623217.1 cobalamin biosynthesis protein CbiX [Alkalilimnicola sp. S0819]MPQ17066.1 cobalamin biosynthesis protein CbiX [Alkalilimnicola sp. S0819]